MIYQDHYEVEPWALRETRLDLDRLAQAESVFALSNGHVGVRGTLEEGEPVGLPGTYLNGFHEVRPLPYAELAYGQPEAGETVVSVSNGTVVRLLVDDEPFDLRYGQLRSHERVLDFRAGVLRREVEWESPAGRRVRVRSTRLVSLTQRAVLAISYEAEPVDGQPLRLVIQSELVTNAPIPDRADDPRAAAALRAPLVAEFNGVYEHSAMLVHHARASGLRAATFMDHDLDGVDDVDIDVESYPDGARATFAAVVAPGQRLRVDKYVGYGWSSVRSAPALRAQVHGAIAEARHTGWDGLLAAQREVLDDFWDRADVQVDGDEEIQQAVRFALFHIFQAGARVESRAIAAKGLTGPGYDGHAFWDTESFVLQVLTLTEPRAARDALHWRHSTLDQARERARQLGLAGAAFPWRTISGRECSGYWPAGTAAFHVSADIADATVRYLAATGDEDFEREQALELLVETARLWRSLGHHGPSGEFRIPGVTGPDEYSALGSNNVFTNLMAQRNLEAAADLADRHPRRAAALGVDDEETAAWRDAARAVVVPFADHLGVHEQSEGFTRDERWDFEHATPDQYPLLLHAPYFQLYRKQVVKQADLVLAMHLRGDAFSAEAKRRNFAYYEALTVRDSSLSACTQAVLAAETGHLDLAYDYLGEAALMDLDDLEHNTADGLHVASLAGSWIALVAGFGGLRDQGETLAFAPRLPGALRGLAFSLTFRGRRLRVAADHEAATYRLLAGEPLELRHHGEPVTVTAEEQRLPIPPAERAPAVSQPRGRAPRRRGPRRAG